MTLSLLHGGGGLVVGGVDVPVARDGPKLHLHLLRSSTSTSSETPPPPPPILHLRLLRAYAAPRIRARTISSPRAARSAPQISSRRAPRVAPPSRVAAAGARRRPVISRAPTDVAHAPAVARPRARTEVARDVAERAPLEVFEHDKPSAIKIARMFWLKARDWRV